MSRKPSPRRRLAVLALLTVLAWAAVAGPPALVIWSFR